MKSANIIKGKGDTAKQASWIGFSPKNRRYYKNKGNRQLRRVEKCILKAEDPDGLVLVPVLPGRWN
jgi:hypothetical protein